MAIEQRAAGLHEIEDLPSAKRYCHDMLNHRCVRDLPSTYRVWKITSQSLCGQKTFTKITYKSPDDDPDETILTVDFQNRQDKAESKHWAFYIFLSILMIVFFVAMLEEWKGIYRVALFVIEYPLIPGEGTGKDRDQVHRWSVACVNLLRLCLFCIIVCTGTLFLTSSTSYLDLIFDALSLVFIIQIDELLYATVLRGPMKEEHQEVEAIMIRRHQLPISAMAAEMALICATIGAALCVVWSFCRDGPHL